MSNFSIVMKKVLVTGAAGFIGFSICNKLLENGINVHGLDNLNEYYGSLSNFTKYCGCGEVVNWVGTKSDEPQKYLKQLMQLGKAEITKH